MPCIAICFMRQRVSEQQKIPPPSYGGAGLLRCLLSWLMVVARALPLCLLGKVKEVVAKEVRCGECHSVVLDKRSSVSPSAGDRRLPCEPWATLTLAKVKALRHTANLSSAFLRLLPEKGQFSPATPLPWRAHGPPVRQSYARRPSLRRSGRLPHPRAVGDERAGRSIPI